MEGWTLHCRGLFTEVGEGELAGDIVIEIGIPLPTYCLDLLSIWDVQ